jgi:hypothetical protein
LGPILCFFVAILLSHPQGASRFSSFSDIVGCVRHDKYYDARSQLRRQVMATARC